MWLIVMIPALVFAAKYFALIRFKAKTNESLLAQPSMFFCGASISPSGNPLLYGVVVIFSSSTKFLLVVLRIENIIYKITKIKFPLIFLPYDPLKSKRSFSEKFIFRKFARRYN